MVATRQVAARDMNYAASRRAPAMFAASRPRTFFNGRLLSQLGPRDLPHDPTKVINRHAALARLIEAVEHERNPLLAEAARARVETEIAHHPLYHRRAN